MSTNFVLSPNKTPGSFTVYKPESPIAYGFVTKREDDGRYTALTLMGYPLGTHSSKEAAGKHVYNNYRAY